MNAPRPALSRLGGGAPSLQANGKPADGQWTAWVYDAIKDGKYADVIRVLEREQKGNAESRPVLSLLGWCYYHTQDFGAAASVYGRLVALAPDHSMYRLYQAQALYKAGQLAEAARCASRINVDIGDGGELKQRVVQLMALVKYREGDLRAARGRLDEMPDDSHRVVNLAALSFREKRYDEALRLYELARKAEGNTPKLGYNVALCLFHLREYGRALKELQEVIDRAAAEHPELHVRSGNDGAEQRSVGNSALLIKTRLIECFNLKAGIYLLMRENDYARETLRMMPPRQEEELDEITLHNLALVDMDSNPTAGFAKLQFLLQSPSAPQETFSNLLLLYCKFGYLDIAEGVMRDHGDLVANMLDRDTREFLQASILATKSPEEAYVEFNELSNRHTENLRRLLKNVQEARKRGSHEGLAAALDAFNEDGLNAFMPFLMAQCQIYWDIQNYHMVMKVLRQSREFCEENPVWQLNMAHAFFLMDEPDAYTEAINFYLPFVLAAKESLLAVKENVLANLCVAYIMTSQNDKAEELMRQIEREEERLAYQHAAPDAPQPLHHCIVNLVIGTLYCSKGNFEFGISRVIRSLEPYQKKLEADTWFYAKRCLLALADGLAKHTLTVPDQTHAEVMAFLDEAEKHGRKIVAAQGGAGGGERTVATEARLLKRFFLKLREP